MSVIAGRERPVMLQLRDIHGYSGNVAFVLKVAVPVLDSGWGFSTQLGHSVAYAGGG
jgi:hypothetical protein